MKFTRSALLLVAIASSPMVGEAFVSSNHNCQIPGIDRTGELSLSPQDLTDYMAKAHEEKIRAIQEVEQKKNAVIQALKEEVKELKSIPKESSVVLATPPSTGNVDLSSLTIEELRAKLVAYQQFMANYIVRSHEQKQKAVQAAEVATAAKYEGKIKLLLEAKAAPAPEATALPTSSADTKLYDTRSANVAAAAKAGKSRWGAQEVAKVQIQGKAAAPSVTKSENLNGSVDVDKTASPDPVSLPGASLFEGRNDRIVAAANAGKSRWGDAEIAKVSGVARQPSLEAKETSPPPTPAIESTPEIAAADHGMRNDGGVGGPSLAERVNLGQQLFSTGSSVAVSAPASSDVVVSSGIPAPVSMYDRRNAKIAAAAAAGKSRWGSMENTKVAGLAALVSVGSSKPAVTTSPEIEAADHGMRNDGGVGGPSLAERVNLGSNLGSP